jgi:hypothetical protein
MRTRHNTLDFVLLALPAVMEVMGSGAGAEAQPAPSASSCAARVRTE